MDQYKEDHEFAAACDADFVDDDDADPVAEARRYYEHVLKVKATFVPHGRENALRDIAFDCGTLEAAQRRAKEAL